MNARQDTHFFTIPEVQKMLGIKSRKTILKYINSGQLRAYKMGGTRWRFAAKDVTAFLVDCSICLKSQSAYKEDMYENS